MDFSSKYFSFFSSFIFSLFFLQESFIVTASIYRYKLNSVNVTANASNSTRHGHHKWIGPVGNRVITVDVHGSGEFRSVQDAVDAVPDNNRENVLILIGAGYYM